MNRRDFITFLGGAAAAWPLAARAQEGAVPLIGYLGSESPGLWVPRLRGFRQGLGEAGYVEGGNVSIEFRWAQSDYDRLPALAADLVRLKPNVIFASPGLSALAAKAATATIPIVFTSGIDAVESGLVASLSRPGGNLTGATNLVRELEPKQLELLHELVPAATTIACLINPTNPVENRGTDTLEAAARSLGLKLLVLQASSERDFDAVFASLLQQRADALLMSGPLPNARPGQLAALAMRHAIPAIIANREFAVAGGLASYGGSIAEQHRIAGVYVGRILKGAKPADLPVQETTKVELVINLKTAKALGITVPITLLGRADEVIE
jgi:putative tryptophan/tyrosine transport system substrate-binding protein